MKAALKPRRDRREGTPPLTDDLKKLSVQRLRELARAHLGKGRSRLRTKAELLAALKGVLRSPLSKVLDAAQSMLPSEKRVRVVDFPPGGRPARPREAPKGVPAESVPSAGRTIAGKAQPHGSARQPKRRVRSPGAEAQSLEKEMNPAGTSVSMDRAGGQRATRRKSKEPSPSAAPVPPVPPRAISRTKSTTAGGKTSSLVPRVAREESPSAAPVPPVPPKAIPRTKSMTAGAKTSSLIPRQGIVEPPVEEGFFEIPALPRRARALPSQPQPREPSSLIPARDAGTEAPVLLVRDPTTLFVFWDFRRELERGAALGLREPRTLLRLYQGETLTRSMELPLHARSTYVAGLRGGEEYTAEVAFLGRDGWTRPVGRRSAPRRLPPGRPSERLEVRTLRLPWSESLERVPRPSPPQSPRVEPLDSPRRIDLPTSPGAAGGPPGGPSTPRSGRN